MLRHYLTTIGSRNPEYAQKLVVQAGSESSPSGAMKDPEVLACNISGKLGVSREVGIEWACIYRQCLGSGITHWIVWSKRGNRCYQTKWYLSGK
jgi:hypothetical protein